MESPTSSKIVRFDFEIEDSMPVLDAALLYLRAGRLPVFTYGIWQGTCTCRKGSACGKNAGKHPIRNNWTKAAQNEEELRDEHTRLKTRANVGLILGEQPKGEYLVAIDVDDQDRFEVLQRQLGPLSLDTPACRSGRGPRYFFRVPEVIPRARIRNRTALMTVAESAAMKESGGKPIPGVDVKVGGGQVVVAPSMHQSGRTYKWTRYGEVQSLPIAWADLLLEEIPPPKFIHSFTPETFAQDERAKKRAFAYLQKAVTEESARLAHMPEGARNTYLHRKAIRLLALANESYSIAKWEYVIRQLENAAVHAGLPRGEIRKTLASAEKYVVENEIVSGPRPLPVYDRPEGTPEPDEKPAEARPAVSLIQDRGQNAAIAENVARLLQHHPDWKGGPGLDAYSDCIYWPSPRPGPVAYGSGSYRKNDRVAVQAWMIQHGVRVGIETAEEGIRTAAMRRQFDSLISWIDQLPPWDGVERLDRWVITYLGCKDNAYNRMTGRSWLKAAVERALHPGLLVDLVPILSGNQRASKNYAINTLFHSDRIDAPWVSIMGKFDPDRLELKRLSITRWILHDDEFKARDPKLIDRIKSWVSMVGEEYIAKYEMDLSVRRRRALLICSTNEKQYLFDTTGNRRWIRWDVGHIDIEGLQRDRLQLLAEAKIAASWREGLDYDLMEEMVGEAEVHDPMRDALLRLATEPVVLPSGAVAGPLWKGWATAEQLGAWLHFAPHQIDQNFQMRLGRAVLAAKGRSKRTGRGSQCIRFYFPPPPVDAAAVRKDLETED